MKIFNRERFAITGVAMLTLFAIIISGCEADKKQNLEDRSYELSWSDEFEGDAGQVIDENKWVHDIGTGDNGWGNQELQYYTDKPENVSLDGNGNLVITAIKETFGGSSFTSGRIKTENLFSQQYGRFEARLKTPYGPGLWPAFWLLGSDNAELGWPHGGEIDIMELRGQQPNIINGTVHGPGYSAGSSIGGSYGFTDQRFDTEFHLFAVEWGKDYINFFVDDILYFGITPEDVAGEWVFNNDFYMVLNVAVGGNYVGFPTSKTPFPQKMIIDYIRVYK